MAFLIAATAGAEALTGTTTGEAAETLATDPGEVETGEDHGDDLGIIETSKEEYMEADNIEENGSDQHQPPSTRTRQNQHNSPDNLENFDERKITRAVHGTDKISRRRSSFRRRRRDELKEKVQSVEDERHAEEQGDDAGEFFHSPDRLA